MIVRRAATIGVLVVAAAFVPARIAVATTHTIDAQCTLQGTVSMSPDLSPTPQPTAYRFSATTDDYKGYNCPADTANPATVLGSLHSDSAYCNGLTALGTAKGRLTITWSPGVSSLLRVTMTPGTGNQTDHLVLTGRVASGSFAGDHFKAVVHYFYRPGGDNACDAGVPSMDIDTAHYRYDHILTFWH